MTLRRVLAVGAVAFAIAVALHEDSCVGDQCSQEGDETSLLTLRKKVAVWKVQDGVDVTRGGPAGHLLPRDVGAALRPQKRLDPKIWCPVSNDRCSGNVCCPAVDATGGKTFPCPNADVNFTSCEGGQAETVKALLAALTRKEKQTFLRGKGWVNGSWDLNPEYYIGNAGLNRSKYGIPTLNMQDNGQGFRTVAEVIIPQVTSWPETLAVASSWSEADTRAWAAAMGKEFKIKGSNVILGPGLNIHRVALGGRNGEYVTGESPYFGARMAVPFVQGIQSEGVLAVAKHFALNNQETNRDTVDSLVDDRTLHEVYYPPLEAAVKAGAGSFMCGYNLANGVHECGNSDTLNRDLKGEMGFVGLVQSDWWALHSFAAENGVDQEMPGDSTLSQQSWLTDSNLDTLSDYKIDDMVSRMLTPMLKYGLFETRNRVCSPPACHQEIYEAVATNDEHQRMSKELAANAVILLKNDGLLPLNGKISNMTLGFVGPACDAPQDVTTQLSTWDLGSYYNIGGSGRVIASDPESITKAVTSYCEKKGCKVLDYTPQVVTALNAEEAAAAVKGADVVFLCGGTSSTEGKDRSTLSVDDEAFLMQVAGIIQDQPLVSLTMTPAAIVMPWIDHVDAALNLFLAGKYTGSAFADAIFGVRNPSAKLVLTFPRSENATIKPCKEVLCPYTEKLKVGYLGMAAEDVLFPFGHGLSYTKFSYTLNGFTHFSNTLKGMASAVLHQLSTSAQCTDNSVICISITVQNTGDVSGVEIAQLYLTFPEAAGEPVEQLRGFHRTRLLQPLEEENVLFGLTERDLQIYSGSKHAWERPQGTFEFYVGASSWDIRAGGKFTTTEAV